MAMPALDLFYLPSQRGIRIIIFVGSQLYNDCGTNNKPIIAFQRNDAEVGKRWLAWRQTSSLIDGTLPKPIPQR